MQHKTQMTFQDIAQFDGDQIAVVGGVKNLMKELGASSSDLWKIHPDKLEFLEGFNSRTRDQAYDDRVRALADAMKSEGFNPEKPLGGIIIEINGVKQLRIFSGYRRGEAVKLANKELAEAGLPIIEHVPVVIRPVGTSILDLTAELVVGNNGDPLRPHEVAAVCKRMMRYGLEPKEIAARLQISSAQYVENLLLYAGASPAIQAMIEHFSVSHIIEVIKEHGSKALDVLTDTIERSKKAGQKPSVKFTPGRLITQAVKKSASNLHSAIGVVTKDPAYASLSEETRKVIEEAMAVIKQAQEKEAALVAGGETQAQTQAE